MLLWIQFLLITPISFHKTIHLGAMCIYNYITVPPHTEYWQIATNIHRICISSLLSLIQRLTLIPSIGICLYTQPQMLPGVGMVNTYPECMSLMPDNVNLGCWAWNGTPPCSWSFSASWFFHAGTHVLRRHLAPSLYLYLFLWKNIFTSVINNCLYFRSIFMKCTNGWVRQLLSVVT